MCTGARGRAGGDLWDLLHQNHLSPFHTVRPRAAHGAFGPPPDGCATRKGMALVEQGPESALVVSCPHLPSENDDSSEAREIAGARCVDVGGSPAPFRDAVSAVWGWCHVKGCAGARKRRLVGACPSKSIPRYSTRSALGPPEAPSGRRRAAHSAFRVAASFARGHEWEGASGTGAQERAGEVISGVFVSQTTLPPSPHGPPSGRPRHLRGPPRALGQRAGGVYARGL